MSAGHSSAVQHYRHFCALHSVRRPGDNLDGLCSDIHLTDHQFVRIRMGRNLPDLSDYNFVQVLVQHCKSLAFGSGQRHRVHIFLRVFVKSRHIFLYP